MPAIYDDVPLLDLRLVPRPDFAKATPLHLQSRLRLRILENLLLARRTSNAEIFGKRHVRRALS
eukprot:11401525-Alexandrium_andersonii.AAC.1